MTDDVTVVGEPLSEEEAVLLAQELLEVWVTLQEAQRRNRAKAQVTP